MRAGEARKGDWSGGEGSGREGRRAGMGGDGRGGERSGGMGGDGKGGDERGRKGSVVESKKFLKIDPAASPHTTHLAGRGSKNRPLV